MTSVFPHRTTRYDKTAKLQRQRRHAALNAEMDRALTRPSKADLCAMLAQAAANTASLQTEEADHA